MVVVKSTTVVVERDAKAMRRCGLITVLMLDHDLYIAFYGGDC